MNPRQQEFEAGLNALGHSLDEVREIMRASRSVEEAQRLVDEHKDVVRRSWKRFAASGHPDRGGCPERFKLARAAYEQIQKATVMPPQRPQHQVVMVRRYQPTSWSPFNSTTTTTTSNGWF